MRVKRMLLLSPKGKNATAQGNALGKQGARPSPERAAWYEAQIHFSVRYRAVGALKISALDSSRALPFAFTFVPFGDRQEERD